MAGSAATLAIKIVADSSQAQSELNAASGRMGKFQRGIGKMAIPAAIAGAAIIKFGSDAVSAARESELAQNRLRAVFKATGDETGRSAKQAEDYASALSRQIGVDDEVIMAGEAKLATFKKVSDQTAMMNGVFERATAAGADLAAAGFGSIESNAVLLGKALNDPVKGMAALARVGVTLTASQEKQAKAMAETGDIAGAQKVILKAVEGQVKGTAAATATSADKSKVAWGEFMESFGRVLLPLVDMMAAKFGALANWMNKNVTTVQILVGVIAGLAAAILIANAALKVYEVVTGLANAATATKIAIDKAAAKGSKLAAAAQWLWNAAMSAIPILLVIAGIAALIAIVVVLYKKNKTFRDFVQKMWKAISAGARAFGSAVKQVFNALKPVFRVAGAILKATFKVAFAAVKTYLGVVKAYFVLVFNIIKGVVKAVVAVFKGDWRGAFSAVKGVVQAFKQFFVSIFHALPGPVQDVLRRIATAVSNGFSRLKNMASGLGDKISAPFETLYDWVQKVIGAVGDLISKISSIHVPDIHLPSIPGLGKATPATAPAPALSRGATRGVGATAATAGSSGPTFIIQGALDPEAVARQIDQLLRRRERRLGRV